MLIAPTSSSPSCQCVSPPSVHRGKAALDGHRDLVGHEGLESLHCVLVAGLGVHGLECGVLDRLGQHLQENANADYAGKALFELPPERSLVLFPINTIHFDLCEVHDLG